MLDLEAIKARWVEWNDYQQPSMEKTMLNADIPALIAEVERIPALIAAAVEKEREACAIECEYVAVHQINAHQSLLCAATIRARGDK